MTTLANPLGTAPFWVNVYEPPFDVQFHWTSREEAIDGDFGASYRLKVTPWVPHDGGPCPVGPHVLVRVRTRDGWVDQEFNLAGMWGEIHKGAADLWKHEGSRAFHIIAYQIEDAPVKRGVE